MGTKLGVAASFLNQPLTALDEILRTADQLDLDEEDRLHERLHWIGGDRVGDGVPESVLGPVPARPAVVRDLSAGLGRGPFTA